LQRGARRTANQTLSLMRQMFRHGMGRGIVDTDPTLAISKKQAGGKETPAERNLSFEEIAELHIKLQTSDLHKRYIASIYFLLATGARIGELTNAKWVDVDETKQTWSIPAANSKNGRAHLIHLSPFSMQQIGTLKCFRTGDFLLAGRKENAPLSEKTISKAIRDRIRTKPLNKRTPKVASLITSGGEWSPHDLRRTMASRMGDLGIEPHVIERCLNHTPQGIIAVYQRQEYLQERRAAFVKLGSELSKLTALQLTHD
jgi:integrase